VNKEFSQIFKVAKIGLGPLGVNTLTFPNNFPYNKGKNYFVIENYILVLKISFGDVK
jgi:hypothetical protein